MEIVSQEKPKLDSKLKNILCYVINIAIFVCFSVLRQGLAIQAMLASLWPSCLQLSSALITDVSVIMTYTKDYLCVERPGGTMDT